jgi:hypothetical protein
MTVLATVALIVLIFVGIMVLRMKSDPMEKESVRKLLAKPPTPEAASQTASKETISNETNSEQIKDSGLPRT